MHISKTFTTFAGEMLNLLNFENMKKLFSLGLLLVWALAIQAQNYPQPFGIKVGQSTKEEIKQKLTNLGIEHEEDAEDNALIVFEGDFGWLGAPMKAGMYIAFDDTLNLAMFMGENQQDGVAEKFMKDVRVKYNENEAVLPELASTILDELELSGKIDSWSQDGDICMIAFANNEVYGVALCESTTLYGLAILSILDEEIDAAADSTIIEEVVEAVEADTTEVDEEISDEEFFELLLQLAEEIELEEETTTSTATIATTREELELAIAIVSELFAGEKVDYMTTCLDVTFDGTNVTYIFEVDETYASIEEVDMQQLKQTQAQILQTNVLSQGFAEKVKKLGGKIKYKYIGSISGLEISYSLW